MSRISTQAANTVLLSRIFETQQSVFQREIQATSEKKSQDYLGIARDSRRLINIENTRTQLQRYVRNNEQVDVRLEITETMAMSEPDDRKKANVRLGLILASIVAVFFLGFMAKMVLLGR